MLIEDEDEQLNRCVEVLVQWSFALNGDNESFFSTTTDAALPSFVDGGTYQKLAVISWSYYFDCKEMLNIKNQIEGGTLLED